MTTITTATTNSVAGPSTIFSFDVAARLAPSDRFLLLFLLMVVIFIMLNLNRSPRVYIYIVCDKYLDDNVCMWLGVHGLATAGAHTGARAPQNKIILHTAGGRERERERSAKEI